MNRVYNFVAARGNGVLKRPGSWIAIAALAVVSSAPAAATTQLRFTLTGDVDATWTLPQNTPVVDTGSGWVLRDVPMVFEGTQQNLRLEWQNASSSLGSFAITTDVGFPMFGGFGDRFLIEGVFSTGTFAFSSFDPFPPGNGTLTIAVAPQGVIPEPATWGLLITGFGLVGAAARRRTATTLA